MKSLPLKLLPLWCLLLLLAVVACDRTEEDVAPTRTVTLELNPDQYNTLQNTALTLSPLTNDTITGEATVTMGQPQHGTITPGQAPGSYVYTPATGYAGPESFTYTVCIGQLCKSATISITVIDPVTCQLNAADDNATATTLVPKTINVLTNDQTCGQAVLTVDGASAALGVVQVVNNGTQLQFTATQPGSHNIIYRLTNGQQTDSAFVSIVVTDSIPNPCPWLTNVMAVTDSLFMRNPNLVTVSDSLFVLANDSICTFPTTQITIIQQPQGATAQVMTLPNGQQVIWVTTNLTPGNFFQLQYRVCSTIGTLQLCDDAWVRVQMTQ